MLNSDLRRNHPALKGLRLREPNGQPSRAAKPKQEVVYIVRQEGSDRIKVGRTANAAGRIATYENVSGVPVHFAVQLRVATKEDSRRLERHLIEVFAGRFERFKREWFRCADMELFETVSASVRSSPVVIQSVAGAPDLVLPPFDRHRAESDGYRAGSYRTLPHR